MENKKLTVAIPTFNGERSIKKALSSIIDNISNVEDLSIIVVDNDSEDSTAEVVKNFITENSHIDITYYKNETNIGYDRNVDMCVQKSKTDYIWFLSDDDIIVNMGLDKVIDVISDSKPDYILANFENEIYISNSIQKNLTGDQFFTETRFKCGLISSNVVRRQTWLDLDMKRYFDCLWIHFAYAVEALSSNRNGSGAIIGEYIIKDDGIPRWGSGGSFINTGMLLLDIFTKLKPLSYSRKVQILGNNVILKGYTMKLLIAKKNGFNWNFKFIKKLYKYSDNKFAFWFSRLPVLLVPNILVRTSVNLLKGLRSR